MKRLRLLVPEIGWYSVLKLKENLAEFEPLQSHVNQTTFVPGKGDVVLNYGVIKWPAAWIGKFGAGGATIINSPDNVRNSTNRRESLPRMKEAGVRVPAWTQHYEKAKEWLAAGDAVIARKNKRSYGGAGIVFVQPGGVLPPDHALYVKYREKKTEFRVHVFGGKVIDLQEKRTRLDYAGVHDKAIRSYDNGWVLCRQNVVMPQDCIDQSLKAVKALGLDFGATDVGWDPEKQKATVYEVNTAPGLTGTTFSRYAAEIRSICNAVG
jgi:hypothetical protein